MQWYPDRTVEDWTHYAEDGDQFFLLDAHPEAQDVEEQETYPDYGGYGYPGY